MIEMIGRPFVIICAFLAVLALLISGAYTIIGSNDLANNQQSAAETARLSAAFSPSELANITHGYHLLSPGVIPVSSMAVGSYWTHVGGGLIAILTDANPPMSFTDTDAILVYLIVSTEYDSFHHVIHPVYLFFLQEWGGIFGLGKSIAVYQVGVDSVLNHTASDGNSYIDVTMEKSYTIIIHPNNGTNLQTDWNTHSNFNISMGQSWANASAVTSGDALQIIGEIMTFSVPNVDPSVNMLLAAILIPTYAILIFFVVRSFIPWLGG